MRWTLEVELDGVGSLVRGPKSRDLVETITGRAPLYSHQRKGWSCQETTAVDVAALAQTRGYDVIYTGPRAMRGGHHG